MVNETCNGFVYTIQKDDTFYKLSNRFGVPLALILRANPYIDVYNLQIGDRICIPTVIIDMYDEYQGITPVDSVEMVDTFDYVVTDKDSLLTVLNHFNLSLDALLRYNHMNSLKLKEGITLQIPNVEDDEEEYLEP